MARETNEARRARAARIIDALEAAIPQAKIALDYSDELQLLVAVMLSAQTTDALVNKVTPALFARYRTAADYAAATEEELREALRRIGLFRNKAKNLKRAMELILSEHQGSFRAPARRCRPCRAWAGRRRGWWPITPSGRRRSRSTPTSGGWRGGWG